MNGELLRAAVTGVYETAHTLGWRYGNSETLPPCADGLISCDRGAVSRPLWILGYHDQQQGGESVGTLDSWLVSHGFRRSYSTDDIRRNSIVLMRHVSQPVPDWRGHAFFVADRYGDYVSKYDFGDQWRIEADQPFHAPINEWPGKYEFYAVYWWPEDIEDEPPEEGIYLKVGD